MFEFYIRHEYAFASAQLVLAMLGMGAVLAPRDFVNVLRAPRGLLLGLGLQLVAVPVLALSLGAVLPVTAGIAAGMVLIASVPGGTISNVLTYLGGGNFVLSIALTGLTTLAALFVTPALLQLLLGSHLPADFDMPTQRVAIEIAFNLLLPLTSGMILGALLPNRRAGFSRWCIRGSLFVIVLIVIGASGSGRLNVSHYDTVSFVAVIGLCVGAQVVAVLASKLAGIARGDRLALVIEVTVRNANLALLLKASLFPAADHPKGSIGDGVFFVTILYGGVAFLAIAPALVLARRGR